MNALATFASFLLFVGSVNGQSAVNDTVGLFLRSIQKLKSFDATMSVEDWDLKVSDYEKGTNGLHHKVVAVETNRDVFSAGIGRRVERTWNGKPLGIGVIEWKTAVAVGQPLAYVLSQSNAGFWEYVNPLMGQEGCFLADALTTNTVTIGPLQMPDDSRRPGFELDFPKHETFQNVFRIWLDPEHGYMITRFERLVRSVPDDGKLNLIEEEQVEQFIPIKGDVWIPAIAVSYNVASSRRMLLDQSRSSFNSISSGQLFSEKSLPKVNRKEDGWKEYLPPDELVKAGAYDTAMHPSTQRHGIRLILLSTMLLGLVAVFAICNPGKRVNETSGAGKDILK